MTVNVGAPPPWTSGGPTERSAQAPRVERWHRRLLGPLHVTGAFWYRFHLFGARVLPSWALGPFVLFFSTFFTLALGGTRRAITSNLDAVLGPATGGGAGRLLRAWRTIWNHSWCMTDSYRQLAGRAPRGSSEVLGREVWEALTGGPRGFVVVTAHVGYWEVGSRLEKPGQARRVHVVREPELDAAAQEFLSGLLEARSGDDMTYHFSTRDPLLGPRLLAALRRGDAVALQADRPAGHGRTVTAQLFGRPLELPAGPCALARAAAVPVVPVFSFMRPGGGCQVVVRDPIEIPPELDLRSAVQLVAEQVEWAIRRAPAQWFCFRQLWNDSDSGADSTGNPR